MNVQNGVQFKFFPICIYLKPALSDRELVEEPHVVNQNVEEPDFVSKARGDVKAGWMYCHAVDLLPEPLK